MVSAVMVRRYGSPALRSSVQMATSLIKQGPNGKSSLGWQCALGAFDSSQSMQQRCDSGDHHTHVSMKTIEFLLALSSCLEICSENVPIGDLRPKSSEDKPALTPSRRLAQTADYPLQHHPKMRPKTPQKRRARQHDDRQFCPSTRRTGGRRVRFQVRRAEGFAEVEVADEDVCDDCAAEEIRPGPICLQKGG